METVLVVGGTGLLGQPVARRLAADGHQVRILTRRPEAAKERFREAAIAVFGGDVEDPSALEDAMTGCSGVHLSLDGAGDWDLERRAAEGLECPPLDAHFLAALEWGMPESAGVALGVDRLLMAATGSGHIDEVLAFPLERA